jgi:hypothetical protein
LRLIDEIVEMAADERISACVDNDCSFSRTEKFPSGNFSGFPFPAASVFGIFQIPVHPQKFPVARFRELPIQVIDLSTPELLLR